MASPSLCKWSRTTKSYATTKLSSSPCNPSVFFSFYTSPLKRPRITASSLHDSSSSSSSSSSTVAAKAKQRTKKSVTFDNSTSQPNASLVESDTRSLRRSALSFKSLFGRRALWRRIFFASKKVRSIILLNVIAIVYARGDVRIRNAGIELGFWVSLGYLMQAFGLLTSDAGRASFLSMFTIVVVPLLDGMLGAKIPPLIWFGALMSIVGVALLESSGSPPSVGDLWNFLSAVFFGVHMLRTEHISRSTKKEDFLPLLGYEICVIALSSTIWYFLGSCFGGIQAYGLSSWSWTLLWNWIVTFPWIPALYTGIFSTGLCLWVEMAAMRDVSATETAIIYGLEPLWGAGFAWFLLGERWGAAGWIGAALVLGGSLTVQIFGSSPIRHSEDEERSENGDKLFVSDKQNDLSTSPVIVSSRKDVPARLKKPHHL
ncbi:uncharacterized protein LOC132179877 isoform X2 [Corylus avellana]|uniref:uncharacterized protein LOC132179877 isoform X2 n=1 Tax=Corylus avellana TaxID=13451 RepID=UPI00286CEF2A|nr:uncharacterized protein LOC132179877 isoform X2 [Corylus avellana]